MNEATGFPAPTLPAPGSAPVAPAPAPAPALATPAAFAVPTDAPTDLPTPSAAEPLTAPSLPGVAAPTLPPAGVAVLATPDSKGPTPVEPEVMADAEAPAARARTNNSRMGKFLPIVLVVGAGALGYVGFTSMSDESTDDVAEPTPVTVAPAASSPLVVPINDAEAVVDQINDNGAEQEALDELGLDARGAPPVTEAPRTEAVDLTVGAAVQIHAGDVIKDDLVSVIDAPTFKYQFQRGTTAEQSVWVDSSSGNRELFDGTTYVRVVDGATFQTPDPTSGWVSDPAVMPTDPLALLGGMVTIEQVLPADLLDEVAASTANEVSVNGQYLFIDTELAGAAPDARASWLTSWGLDPAIAPVGIDGFVDGVPAAARPGMILVSVVSSADGIVTSLTIEAPAIGETVSYRLLGASMDPLTIGQPATVIE